MQQTWTPVFGSNKTQDYTALKHYFTKEHWQIQHMPIPPMHRLDAFTSHAKKLGC